MRFMLRTKSTTQARLHCQQTNPRVHALALPAVFLADCAWATLGLGMLRHALPPLSPEPADLGVVLDTGPHICRALEAPLSNVFNPLVNFYFKAEPYLVAQAAFNSPGPEMAISPNPANGHPRHTKPSFCSHLSSTLHFPLGHSPTPLPPK